MNIPMIIMMHYPNANWQIFGESYEDLVWVPDSEKPSKEIFEELWPGVIYNYERERIELNRKQAYAETSDPIFFKYQRGDATEQDWLNAVQKIKNENPYPEPPE
jgi:hypothetical protein